MSDRKKLLKRGRWVETASLIYNICEVIVSVTAGLITGSSALISWGLDSTVEAGSAATMIWRLHGEETGISQKDLQRRKKIALSVISAAFWTVVAFILYEVYSKFQEQTAPEFSALGIGILVLSLIVNPFLAWGKYRYGKKLGAKSLKYDAKDTLICQYQTIVVLIGLGLVEMFGWWWADPVAALAIVPYVAWEGFNAGRDAYNINERS
ncbi:MAG: cation transporter [Alphaproteobacteria bacterium]|jgi:cation diffusion facilitator family transporter|nr:cation transporter [Alphaproteobacteria bacterium]